MKGSVHSIESFGTVDGPGIRLVVFMQGCPLRCLYCHNPDSWRIGVGKETDASEIIAEFERNSSFYSNGGITVSGGEPLLQLDFLTELFTLAKEKRIHTCIDTSGITYREDLEYLDRLDKLLSLTDLVMLDVKHTDPEAHRTLTGATVSPVLAFLSHLDSLGVETLVRRVIVKGYTDDPDELYSLGRLIGSHGCVKSLDVLPYHSLGVSKYAELGIDYPLVGMPPVDKEYAASCRSKILDGVRSVRNTKSTSGR